MYFVFVFLTTIILPLGFTLWQATGQPLHAISVLALKWFVIWGVGVRLGVSGARQFFQPRFTAREIFKLDADGVLTLVKELGGWHRWLAVNPSANFCPSGSYLGGSFLCRRWLFTCREQAPKLQRKCGLGDGFVHVRGFGRSSRLHRFWEDLNRSRVD